MSRPASKKAKTWKAWAAIDAEGKLRHVRMADYREPVATLRWLGYQPVIITLPPPPHPGDADHE